MNRKWQRKGENQVEAIIGCIARRRKTRSSGSAQRSKRRSFERRRYCRWYRREGFVLILFRGDVIIFYGRDVVTFYGGDIICLYRYRRNRADG